MLVIYILWKFEIGIIFFDGLVVIFFVFWSMIGNEVVGSDVILLILKWVINLEREMIFMWIFNLVYFIL